MQLNASINRHALGMLLVAGSAIAWSTAGYFTRLIPLDAWTILFWRGLFGGAAIALYFLIDQRSSFLKSFLQMRWQGVVVSILSAIGMLALLGALKLTSVANVVLIYAASPFVTAAAAWLLMRERVAGSTMVASLIGFIGIAIMACASSLEGRAMGIFLALVMTVTVSLTTVMIRKYQFVPMVPAVCVSAFLGTLFSIPFATPSVVTSVQLIHLALFGVTQMGLGLVLYVAGSRLVPSAQTALISLLETPLAPFWVWIAFGEIPSGSAFIGGSFVLVAVLGLVVYEKGKQPRPAAAVDLNAGV